MTVFFRTLLILLLAAGSQTRATELTLSTFEADVTPPLGAPLCGGGVPPVQSVQDPLTARGVVLIPAGQAPIVLCAVDWVGIGNNGHKAWREALAQAAGTDPSRVSVHVLHQHDAPFCDFSAEALAAQQDLGGKMFDVPFARKAITETADAVAAARSTPRTVTHISMGEGIVRQVASNRRILDENNKVRVMRWTATGDPAIRAEPVGTIDPYCKSVAFWNDQEALAVLTYYATHPQSHYGKGHVSTDFVGMARDAREKALPGVPHIHFNGAGGNLGAGKWNDGAPENRPVLARKLAAGMERAWQNAKRMPIATLNIDWRVVPVSMPGRANVSRAHEEALLANADAKDGARLRAAMELAWMNRSGDKEPIELSRLRSGPVQLVHLPGELFVEYQLAAQDLALDDFVCVAAYADYGPGYIGTKAAYREGGYETAVYVAHCGPEVEDILMDGIRELVQE